MARRVGRTVVAAVTIGAALLVGNLLLSTLNTRQLRDESANVAHSSELLLALDNVLSLVKDAETGQRGYVITGKPEYLEPYRNAVANVHRQLDSLAALAAADPVQLGLLAEMRRHVNAKLGEIDLTIGLRDRKGFDLTRDVILLGAGKAEMDALQSAAARMATHETRQLVERQAGADRIYRWTVVSEFVAGLVAILALFGYAHVLRRHLAARDRSEAVIAAQGEMLRMTLASIGDAVITTDVAGRVADLNAVAESLTGWRGEEARGQPLESVFRIVNEETRQPVENPAARALRDGVVVGLANHTLLIRKDGAEVPIDDSAAPIRERDGKVHGCILVFRDISDRKDAERQLGEAQSRLARVVTDMAIPTMVYADDGEVILVNRAWTRISGFAAGDLTTISAWTKHAYGARAEAMNEVISSLFDLAEAVDNGEREITTASGEKRIWHFVTVPLGRDGRGRRMLVTNAVDVTEQRRLDQVLVEKEARMRLAMDAANYGGWEWDRHKDEMVWTDKTRELLGVGPDEPISFERFQKRIHPDDRDRRARAISQAWLTGVHGSEYRIVRPDGEVRWVSSRGRVVRGPDGSERMLGVVGDITEQKKAVEALKEADRRKDEFLATLAHELRNPLAPLRNSLAVLQRTADDPATFDKASGVMERQLSHLVRLIDDLLDVSRISLDKLTLRLEVADLNAVIEHAVEASRPAAERAGHELHVDLSARPIRLRADRARLSQVFSNLIGNACKFTPDGGRVDVAVRVDGADAVVSVRDNGIGIAADRLGGVFEMFSQIDNSLEREHGGLGIGLTLVRRLVDMHGGRVVATSGGLGAGSEFVVTLPLMEAASEGARGTAPPATAPAQAAAVAAATASSPMPAVAPAPGSSAAQEAASAQPAAPRPAGSLRVLVVDDNGDSADSLAMLLSLSGHETHVARSGPEALTSADALRPDAVLLDLGLPGLNGFEVCRRLRAGEWAGEIPIIAITGWGQAEDRQRSKDAGFDGHLVKPVVLAELTALLEGSLR